MGSLLPLRTLALDFVMCVWDLSFVDPLYDRCVEGHRDRDVVPIHVIIAEISRKNLAHARILHLLDMLLTLGSWKTFARMIRSNVCLCV